MSTEARLAGHPTGCHPAPATNVDHAHPHDYSVPGPRPSRVAPASLIQPPPDRPRTRAQGVRTPVTRIAPRLRLVNFSSMSHDGCRRSTHFSMCTYIGGSILAKTATASHNPGRCAMFRVLSTSPRWQHNPPSRETSHRAARHQVYVHPNRSSRLKPTGVASICVPRKRWPNQTRRLCPTIPSRDVPSQQG